MFDQMNRSVYPVEVIQTENIIAMMQAQWEDDSHSFTLEDMEKAGQYLTITSIIFDSV